MTPPTPAEMEAALERVMSLDTPNCECGSCASRRLVVRHVAILERRALAAEARAERYETELRRCEHWFTAYIEGHDDGQFEAGSLLPAIRAALANDDGGDESWDGRRL